MKIYVSNLDLAVQTRDLEKAFMPYGIISSINVIMNRSTNQNRGFAFIEMADKNASEKAIRELNGSLLGRRPIKVHEAIEREEQSSKKYFL